MESTESPGWDAITAACNQLYPGQEPRHFGYLNRPTSFDALAFDVRPTEITDAQGRIVETIG